MRVLLFEDDCSLRDVLTEFLNDEGFTVVAVSDAAAVLRHAADGPWVACIADCSPLSNGVLDERDRALFGALAQVAPVILTTGRAWTRDISAAELGVAAILVKPFDLSVLLRELEAATRVYDAPQGQRELV